jgi:nicotinamide mononucleotide transporter
MSRLEWVAAALGLVNVGLTVLENAWCWPVGAVMVALYSVVFWEQKLYAQAVLMAIFFVLQFYGLYHWLYGGAGGRKLPIGRTPRRAGMALLASGAVGTLAIGAWLHTQTDNPLPFWDAGILAFSLVAQWMLARKWVENWPLWIAVDIVTVGVSLRLRLYPTAVLYTLLMGLCAVGFVTWNRQLVAKGVGREALDL